MTDKAIPRIFDLRTLRFLSRLSGLFSLVVVCGLGWYALRYLPVAYFDETDFVGIREDLQKDPAQPRLRKEFRAEDVERRARYLASRRKLDVGAWLLLGGVVAFVLSRRGIATLTKQPPGPLAPGAAPDPERERTASAIAAVGFSSVLMALIFGGFALSRALQAPAAAPKPVPLSPVVVAGTPGVTAPRLVPMDQRWPRFRGPTGMGLVPAGKFPAAWDAEKNQNVLWKVKPPMPGNGSPVIWGDRIFLTGADMDARKVFCFSRQTGALLWTCVIRTNAVLGREVETAEDTGLAAPTCATDGERVYAFFGTNELAAVDFSGKQVWARWLGKPDSVYGVASSPIVYNGLVILQLDQADPDAGKSTLYAFHPKTGRDLWKASRNVGASWSTPVVFDTGARKELVAAGTPWTIAYDPDTGTELWRAKALSGDVAPLPVYADGLVYVETEYSRLAAIRADSDGDVTDTGIVWTHVDDLSDVASPVTDGKLLLIVTGGGYATCLDAKTGKVKWLQEFQTGFWSSPTLVGQTVYLTDKRGKTFIFPLADKYQLQSTGTLGEAVVTTPAFVDSKIYVRGKTHLYAIGAKN